MSFETLILRPGSGRVDVDAIAAHLDALPFAFRDPIKGEVWHLSRTPRLAASARAEREANPRSFVTGVLVSVAPDHVWMATQAERGALARGLELVQWLLARDSWTATGDKRDLGLLTDPAVLFPSGLPDPSTFVEDLTYTPIAAGTLTTWSAASSTRVLVVHSSGQFRCKVGERLLQGQLAPNALATWNESVAIIDPDDPEPETGSVDLNILTSVNVQTPNDDELILLDPTNPPPSLVPLTTLATTWLSALEAWQNGPPPPGFESVRS